MLRTDPPVSANMAGCYLWTIKLSDFPIKISDFPIKSVIFLAIITSIQFVDFPAMFDETREEKGWRPNQIDPKIGEFVSEKGSQYISQNI